MFEKIRALCKEKGTNITSLERRCGISKGSICKWDNNTPSIERVVAVAKELGTTVAYLVGETEDSSETLHDALTENEKEMLALFRKLTDREQLKWIVRLEDYLSARSSSIEAAQLAEVDDKTKNNRQTVRRGG